uniref:Uncharacterized protein n=1 Tax=Rhizophora mucronata TaxID=61149 RepID=A0A2P2R2Z9_RHIMU
MKKRERAIRIIIIIITKP